MSETVSIRIEIPEQGFDQTYRRDEIGQFFEAEQSFLNSLQPMLSEQIQWENRAFHNPSIHSTATRELREIRKFTDNGDSKRLDDYIADARRLQVVIGQGQIGKRVSELLSANRKTDAKWLFYIFSSKWSGGNLDEFLSPIRAAVIGNPMFASFGDVVTAEQASRVAQEARASSEQTAAKFEAFYVEKSKLISDLEELFRKKIPVEASATYWEDTARAKTAEWRGWLILFAVLALLPIVAGLFCWETIAGAIARVTGSGSNISLGGVAIVTVPAVLYLWVLKNISRIFQQRLMLADDAAHRRLLTMTYLGLAKEPRLSITDNDRALILNALFRPIPPHASDDGPPAGLIDLIKKP